MGEITRRHIHTLLLTLLALYMDAKYASGAITKTPNYGDLSDR